MIYLSSPTFNFFLFIIKYIYLYIFLLWWLRVIMHNFFVLFFFLFVLFIIMFVMWRSYYYFFFDVVCCCCCVVIFVVFLFFLLCCADWIDDDAPNNVKQRVDSLTPATGEFFFTSVVGAPAAPTAWRQTSGVGSNRWLPIEYLSDTRTQQPLTNAKILGSQTAAWLFLAGTTMQTERQLG